MNWTLENIPDLSNKTAIVTGANSGLGYYAVKAFAENGAEVILASRNIEKGEEAKNKISAESPNLKITVMQLDLASLESIKSFADEFKSKYQKLDILLNNAGIMAVPYQLTKDGFESQVGVNHLGHFALTAQLFDIIKNTTKARIVNVSSIAHNAGKMDFDNLLYENGKAYSRTKAYGRSKLSNLLFTYELDRRLKKAGIEVSAFAAHPGVAATSLDRYMPKALSPLFHVAFHWFGQAPKMGALPEIRAAVDENAKSGEYYGPNKFMEMKGYPVLVKSNTLSHDLEAARKLWEASEKLTKINFNI